MEQATINETNATPKKRKQLNKKSLVIKKYTFLSLTYVGLFLPMFILGCVNFDKYFTTNKDSFSVAAGGFLMIIFSVILIKVGIKKLHRVVTASFIVAIIICLNSIIKDFLVISCMFWIGIVLYSIFEIPATYYTKLLATWDDESIRMDVRNSKRSEANENNSGENDDYGQI